MTFGHAPYIVDAMNGFTMQETNFPFVCVIVDDASIDGEQEVIKNYLNEYFDLEDKEVLREEETGDYELTFARHKTNRNCYFAVLLLKYNHYSIKKSKKPYIAEWNNTKYIALCEGDDYWIAPEKLQRQVSYMENNPHCSLTISNGFSEKYGEKRHRLINPMPVYSSRIVTIHELFIEKNGLIPTASMCFRSELLSNMPDFVLNAPVGDRPIRMWCATHGDVFYDKTPLLVHRRFVPGSYGVRSKSNHTIAKNVYERMLVFLDSYDAYTNGEYHNEIQYMKEREEYGYYKKIGDKKAMVESKFFQRMSLKVKIVSYVGCYAPILLKTYRWLRQK
jgi:glycosyltransferase involved in cell wall biosynthesis